jgi:ATP-dependent Clp protease adaptor protein ClpS
MTTDTQIAEKIVVSLQPPKLWKVVFLNDEETPMELVSALLSTIFKHDEARAKEITLEIHNTGSGIAGVYTYEIAEQRGMEATNMARANGSPLRIQVEQE